MYHLQTQRLGIQFYWVGCFMLGAVSVN